MNTRLSISLTLLGVLCAGCSSVRVHRIETEPTGAAVFVDGAPAGTAPLDYGFDFANAEARYTVVAKQEGYVDNFVKVSNLLLDGLDEKPIRIKIEEDEAYTNTRGSDAANVWFKIVIDEQLDQSQAWQILVDTVTRYYPELGNLEQEAGYISAEAKTKGFMRGHVAVQVRNQFFCSIQSRVPLEYKVKIESEINDGSGWQPYPRIFKDDEGLIEELLERLVTQ
jgi:hypothetical protein